jgi:3-methyl-2-oxobutanoate hydroxymethyltransferase
MPFGPCPAGIFYAPAFFDGRSNRAVSKQKTILDIRRMKDAGEKITVLTAYDYTFARLMDQAGIDMILVGDPSARPSRGTTTPCP